MKARVTVSQGVAGQSAEQFVPAVEILREQSVPTIRQMNGSLGVIVLSDPPSGKVMTIALWDDEESLRASQELAGRVRVQATEQANADVQGAAYEVQGVDTYEVSIFEVDPAAVE